MERLRTRDGFDLSEVSFLLLRLGSHNHEQGSPEYLIEHDLIKQALLHRIPIGIVCSEDGKITTPFLEKDGRDQVVLVISEARNDSCNPGEVYPQVKEFYTSEHHADEIARFIGQKLPAPPSVGPEPHVTRQPQMVAANTGWSNQHMTD